MNLWLSDIPYSTDPLSYDALSHHVAFRSVLSPLISTYKLGEYVGILAESWSVSEDFKQWSFTIRPNLTFENGDMISPKIIETSFKRIAFLLKNNKSKNEFIDHILEKNKLVSIDTKIKGIKSTNNKIIFTFKKSMPNVLDLISFGLFSIVHPNNYNSQNGSWISENKTIASNFYTIDTWSNSEIILKLRKDFLPNLHHKNIFPTIFKTC